MELLMAAATIVLYHDISATASPFESGLGLGTRPENFTAHLAYFEKNYDLIDLDTLLSGSLPRRPLLLTFDDCYRSVLDVARDVLAPRGVPAVLFTNPDLLGPNAPSLDNILSWYAARHGLPALLAELDLQGYATVAAVLSEAMALRTATQRRDIRDRLMAAGGMATADLAGRNPVLTAADLRELSELGVEIGNHSASHVHCRSLTAEERGEELAGACQKLEQICGRPVRAFSVPYGNEADLTPEVLVTLRASGHSAIFLVHARSNRFRPAPDVWYRVSLHDERPTKLRNRLHMLPLLRSLRALALATVST